MSARPSFSRRGLLGAAAFGLAGMAVAERAGAASKAVTTAKRTAGLVFVLVHGAWHGGWCWWKLAPLLRQAGHRVYTPTLTGVGERSHLLHRGIDLATHIEDVVQVLEFEDLRDVVLVGHSYAGMVITGVASRAGERIGRLVYLDAFVPRSGQGVFDNLSPRIKESWMKTIAGRGEGWRLPPMLDARAMGVTDPADAAWVDARLRPMPAAAFDLPVQYDEEKLARMPRRYIRSAGFPGFGPTAKRLQAEGWRVQEIAAGHDAMVSAPDELAKILLSGA